MDMKQQLIDIKDVLNTAIEDNQKSLGELTQNVVKLDVERYLSSKNIEYEANKQSYMIINQNYNLIQLGDKGFNVWSTKYNILNPFSKFFNIEFEEYNRYNDSFKLNGREDVNIDEVLENYNSFSKEEIEKFIKQIQDRIDEINIMNLKIKNVSNYYFCIHNYYEYIDVKVTGNYYDTVEGVIEYCDDFIKTRYDV